MWSGTRGPKEITQLEFFLCFEHCNKKGVWNKCKFCPLCTEKAFAAKKLHIYFSFNRIIYDFSQTVYQTSGSTSLYFTPAHLFSRVLKIQGYIWQSSITKLIQQTFNNSWEMPFFFYLHCGEDTQLDWVQPASCSIHPLSCICRV